MVKIFHAIAKRVASFFDAAFPATIPDAMKNFSSFIAVLIAALGTDWLRRYFKVSDCLTLGVLSAALLFIGIYTKGHILNQEAKRKVEKEEASRLAMSKAIQDAIQKFSDEARNMKKDT